jgi:hypothetical protein
MNASDKNKIIKHALTLLKLNKELTDLSNGDCWFRHGERQVLRDAVFSLFKCGLIQDFHMSDATVKIDGDWVGVEKLSELSEK